MVITRINNIVYVSMRKMQITLIISSYLRVATLSLLTDSRNSSQNDRGFSAGTARSLAQYPRNLTDLSYLVDAMEAEG